MQRSLTAVIGFVFLMSLVGCSTFQGEWLEEGALNADGSVTPSQTENRMALKFSPPARMQAGIYEENMKAVDGTTVVSEAYYLYEGSKTAQFGERMARVADKNHLIVQVQGGKQVRYVRVTGKSIFPPDVKVNFVSSAEGVAHPELTAPMLASTAAP